MPRKASSPELAPKPVLTPWSSIYVDWAKNWKIGEHVMICAPTGTGKSVAAQEIVTLRRNVVVIGTKRKDKTMDDYMKWGYVRIYDWPPPPRLRGDQYKYVLWPSIETIGDVHKYKDLYARFLRSVFRIPNITVVLDECQFMTEELGLGKLINVLVHQGRSGELTIVSLSQRPAWIPSSVRSASSYALLGKTVDRSDLQALADFGGLDRKDMYTHLRSLDRDDHQLLAVSASHPETPDVTKVVPGTRLRTRVAVK